MRKFQIAVLWAVFLYATPATAQPTTEHEQMLYTAVSVDAGSGTGSGTVVHSDNHDGEWFTYILTNYHVIAAAISINEEWDPVEQEEVKKERRKPVRVDWFMYNKFSRKIGTAGKDADIVAYDSQADLALLRVRDHERGVDYVAYILPAGAPIYLFDNVWAVGAGLGKPPFPTIGVLAGLDEYIDDYPYLLATAPIIFGNSGGALFRYDEGRGRFELIGVPSKVSAIGFGQAVTHMAWSIPVETIRTFMAGVEHEFQ
jgi:S1-C subfamily serine protease